MNKGGKVLVEPVPACHCPLERIEPGKKSFDFPTATITPQGATILRCFTLSIAPMWCDHLNPLGSKGVIERITVIGTICKELVRGQIRKQFSGGDRIVYVARREKYTQRISKSVNNCMNFACQSASCTSDFLSEVPPFAPVAC